MSLGRRQAILSRCGSLTSCAVGMRHEVVESLYSTRGWGCGCADDTTTPHPWPPSVTAPHKRVTGGSNLAGAARRPARGALAR